MCRDDDRLREFYDGRRSTSRDVFRRFFTTDPMTGALDATPVFGQECFETWLETRKSMPKDPKKAYQCAIRTVVTGSNGAQCFTPAEEKAVLDYLRTPRRESWPSFGESGESKTKSTGWKHVRGHHEKMSLGGGNQNDSGLSILGKRAFDDDGMSVDTPTTTRTYSNSSMPIPDSSNVSLRFEQQLFPNKKPLVSQTMAWDPSLYSVIIDAHKRYDSFLYKAICEFQPTQK